MHVDQLTSATLPAFIEYCRAHADEHDSSYLPEASFHADDVSNPTYLLFDGETIRGCASLMLGGFSRISKARFRILHTLEHDEEEYRLLLQRLLPHARNLDRAFAFIPEHQTVTRQVWETLGFNIERYAFVLKHPLTDLQYPDLPAGYTIRDIVRGKEESTYADILNAAFTEEQGRFDKTEADISRMMQEEPGLCLQFLCHDAKPVGVLATRVEVEGDERTWWIDSIGLKPDYQGLRLGKQLLRAAMGQALSHDVSSIMLSVQAQNEKAAELYLNEGFVKEQTMICYEIDPKIYVEALSN